MKTLSLAAITAFASLALANFASAQAWQDRKFQVSSTTFQEQLDTADNSNLLEGSVRKAGNRVRMCGATETMGLPLSNAGPTRFRSLETSAPGEGGHVETRDQPHAPRKNPTRRAALRRLSAINV